MAIIADNIITHFNSRIKLLDKNHLKYPKHQQPKKLEHPTHSHAPPPKTHMSPPVNTKKLPFLPEITTETRSAPKSRMDLAKIVPNHIKSRKIVCRRAICLRTSTSAFFSPAF